MKNRITYLIWFSDAAFQLAGGLAIVGFVLTLAAEHGPQHQRERFSGYATALCEVVAMLAAVALGAGLAARSLYRDSITVGAN